MAMQKRLAFLIVAISVFALPLVAHAQHKSPLADAPAIRKRLELRSTRLELGVGGATTIGQDFYHSVLINVKLGFHITDWLSLAGFGGFAVANIDTGFKDSVVGSLPPDGSINSTRAPFQGVATGSMNKIQQTLGAQLEVTPFTGKYSLFGKLFAHYDFYAFVGPGFINYAATTSSVPTCGDNGAMAAPPAQPPPCAVTGLKIGVNTGVGIHSFINQFLALNFELRDIVSPNNAAGRDVNGDRRVDNNDLTYGNTFLASLNLVLYFPTTADISN
jgi:outer membrane beta-barrel protein